MDGDIILLCGSTCKYNDTYFIKNIQSRTSSCMQTYWCGNHFLPEITRILHLVNLINVATNVNIAKQMCIPKRFRHGEYLP